MDLSKEKTGIENGSIDQIVSIVSTPKRKGAKIKTPILIYEYTDNPNPLALSQAYEILFEEVLRIRKSKKQ